MSNKKKENKPNEKTINDLIIDEAVKQFKEGKIKSSLDSIKNTLVKMYAAY